MSERYPTRHINEFLQLRVFRRVEADDTVKRFIDRTRKAAQLLLGETVNTIIKIDDEEVPAGYPNAVVVDAGDLVLDLLSIRDVPESRSDAKLRSARRNFQEGYPSKKTKQDVTPRPPISLSLEAIASDFRSYTEITGESIPVKYANVAPIFRPGVKNGFYELALFPDMSDPGAKLMLEQSNYLWERLPAESRGLMYPTSDNRNVCIPFCSVRRLGYEDAANESQFLASFPKIIGENGLLLSLSKVETTLQT